ncbi:MAG: hypothetical protein JST14_13430 [Bacteroidetes bacterium]|nr:hypothetical protein [Bacteroidota bacterium]
MKWYKSFRAGFAGMTFAIVATLLTDYVLEETDLMIRSPFDANPSWLIGIVVFYRTVYGVIGSYFTARLAPHHPMMHSMTTGLIGLILSMAGTIVMWHIPPHWYPIALDILALPTAWAGARLALSQMKQLQPQMP